MGKSLSTGKRISHRLLEERLEPVKELHMDELESYAVMKDRETGEHYLVYQYVHVNIAEGGHRETYSHLLPIETDDVLAYLFGEQPYRYPDAWASPYLRNSEADTYVWYDPSAAEDESRYEQIGRQLTEKLAAFKAQGQFHPDEIRKLMAELDRE